jgi:hypothetical protein
MSLRADPPEVLPALDQDDVSLGLQARKLSSTNGISQPHALIVGGLGGAVDAALHDDLRADITLRLQQHGFMCTLGAVRAARACGLGATDSPLSAVTAALFDMFCGLNGRTLRPRSANARAKAATISDLPTSDPVPGT